MSNKIRIGIVGYGSFGEFIFNALAHSEHFRVTAIADNLKNSDNMPAGVEFMRDWQTLLKTDGIDAVIISTPPVSHAEITLASLKAGKHVMTEKPLAVFTRDAVQIQKLERGSQKVVMVDFLQRFNPILEVLQQLHIQNKFGEFERFYVENYAQDETLSPAHWFWDQSISGGILIEHAVHFIDIVHWFQSEEIKHISGFAAQRNVSQTDRMGATVHYKSGLIASHYHSFTRPNAFERTNMRFVFNTAQFDLNGWIPESGNFTILGNEPLMELLQLLPNLQISKKEAIDQKKVRGKTLDFTHLIEGSFASSVSKQKLYAMAVQRIFHDFYLKVKDNRHLTRVTLGDAIKAVYVAETATNNANITNR